MLPGVCKMHRLGIGAARRVSRRCRRLGTRCAASGKLRLALPAALDRSIKALLPTVVIGAAIAGIALGRTRGHAHPEARVIAPPPPASADKIAAISPAGAPPVPLHGTVTPTDADAGRRSRAPPHGRDQTPDSTPTTHLPRQRT